MNKKHILMPWREIECPRLYYGRDKIGHNKNTLGMSGWIIEIEGEIICRAYSPEAEPGFPEYRNNLIVASKYEGIKRVDEELIRLGWRLLEEGDKLLVLL